MRSVNVLVTDLDNTLWDWVDIWYRCFSAMLDIIVNESGIPRSQLEAEARAVHQRHGTSEYAFLIEELPSLRAIHPAQNLTEVYGAAIEAYRQARRQSIRLYDGVMETLLHAKKCGALLVGYTDTQAFYSRYRLKKTELDSVLDYLYSPADHSLPGPPDQIRKYDPAHYELRSTVHRYTPPGEVKPNPRVLLDIIRGVAGVREMTVYVGDSKMKDIVMARDAGVFDAWALYGKAQNRSEYELLRRVSHWTDADVERERAILSSGTVEPSITLEHSFAELKRHVEFVPFR